MTILSATPNPFAGIVVDPQQLPASPIMFKTQLGQSLRKWQADEYKHVWLQVPIKHASHIPIAVEAGFKFHHTTDDYLMLTYQLVAGAFIPAHATHYVGVGGVVINDKNELLVVSEKHKVGKNAGIYKIPGGTLDLGEHIVAGVIREVREETNINTEFESLVCFRHWHGYRFGKSDIYFVCRLKPLTFDIRKEDSEIEECLWLPVADYLASDGVNHFHKGIMRAAIGKQCQLTPGWIEGYEVSRESRELFMPAV